MHKGATACIPPRKNAGLWEKGHPRNEAVWVVDDGQNQSANIQRSGGGSDGVCERNKQTEHPWTACQKAPSVAVTWGWGRCVLTADLGGNAPL